MQPLLCFGAPKAETCDTYCSWGLTGPKNVTRIALWGSQARHMRPLLRFGAPRAEKCDPYNVLGPRRQKKATPIAFWQPGSRKSEGGFFLFTLI